MFNPFAPCATATMTHASATVHACARALADARPAEKPLTPLPSTTPGTTNATSSVLLKLTQRAIERGRPARLRARAEAQALQARNAHHRSSCMHHLPERVGAPQARCRILRPMPKEIAMPVATAFAPNARLSRRHWLQCAALSALAVPACEAIALDLPRLDDLRPKWDALTEGDSIDQVVLRMGNPNRRSEARMLGVTRTDLAWKDIRGPLYTARFFAGRLYAKEVNDNP
ncbi:hypothetical protein KAK07_11860 [Ideonella sp. 4Y16]|uniref:hypothetical protein n=1 Tax=Ideonella alba TaxID=2824118 RepID=UPI001B391311|nr:hypothetical protein [Ideonella alba]MBQ0944030.1 hypothetical protein [Ideonella alba]